MVALKTMPPPLRIKLHPFLSILMEKRSPSSFSPYQEIPCLIYRRIGFVSMMEGTELEQRIEQIVNQKIQARLETVQLALLRKEFLTREEFLAAMQKMDKRFEDMLAEMNRRFETVDKRFEAMDKRFEDMLAEMNRRFETVDKRFEAMDKRFEAVDKRFEDMLAEMNRRFEAVNKRFEAVDKRFEAIDKRFEAVDKRFEALIAEMHQGFEESRRMYLQLRAAIDNLGARSGVSLQETILELMNTLIVKAGVDYKQVQRKTIVDVNGDVFFQGFSTDVDVLARDGEIHLFEVKYKADQRDCDHFLKVARLFEKVEKVRPDKLYLITLEISQKTLRAIAHLPVEIIAGSVVL